MTVARRVLIKLSGEALMGSLGYGLDPQTVSSFSHDIASIQDDGIDVAVVVGGGNIFRGMAGAAQGMDRAQADHMGMLATVMNGLALQQSLRAAGADAIALSAIPMPSVCETYTVRDGLAHLAAGRVVVACGGTGNPFFTTDTAATLRAVELRCTEVLKATQVDGVYSADPKTDPTATRFDEITYDEVLARGLSVMDAAAVALARDNLLPLSIFKLEADGKSIRDCVLGNRPRTRVVAANAP